MIQERFINVFEIGDRTDGRTPSDDDLLGEALALVSRTAGPYTFWVSRIATLGGESPPIPARVTLTFGPGAGLTVAKRLVIEGPLDAGLEPRFELVGDGVVELRGPLDEIVANWWRPSGGRNPVELALQALWARYLHAEANPTAGVLPAPIRLDGPYALSRTLRVVPPDGLAGRVSVALRGQHGRPSDPPTFVLGEPPREGLLDAMMSIEAGVVLTMESVAFDAVAQSGPAWALSCVSLEGTFHGSRIEACSFRHGGAGVRVSPRVQYQMARAAASGAAAASVQRSILADAMGRVSDSTNRLEVSRCLFTGVSFPSGAVDSARGVDIRLGAPTALALRDSQFVGAFANGVAILGGELHITGCQFANQTARIFYYGSVSATADVLVRRWGDDADSYTLNPNSKAQPGPQPVLQTNVINIPHSQPLANTHVTITHCVSTSPVFLVMFQTFGDRNTALGGAVLSSIRHTPGEPRWHSVVLGPGMPPRALILQGCWFGDSVRLDTAAPTGTVVDLGTRFDNRPSFDYGTDARGGDLGSAVVTLRSPVGS